GERVAGASGGVRDGGGAGIAQCRAADRDCSRCRRPKAAQCGAAGAAGVGGSARAHRSGDCSAGEAADGLAQGERGQSAAGEHSGHWPIIATAIATTVADPGVFRSGREFAAWLGLVPRQNSTGGKTRLGGITKRGNRYLRRLLINGASANLLRSKATKADPWVIGLRRRRPPLVVAVALANKTARIAWAV